MTFCSFPQRPRNKPPRFRPSPASFSPPSLLRSLRFGTTLRQFWHGEDLPVSHSAFYVISVWSVPARRLNGEATDGELKPGVEVTAAARPPDSEGGRSRWRKRGEAAGEQGGPEGRLQAETAASTQVHWTNQLFCSIRLWCKECVVDGM